MLQLSVHSEQERDTFVHRKPFFFILFLLSLFSGSEKGCSLLTNFTMKTENQATFEWENGKVAMAYLTKEDGECIYR